MERAIQSLVVTEHRMILLEQPPPVMQGGLRLGLVATAWPLEALEAAVLEAGEAPSIAALRLGIGRGGMGRTYRVELEQAGEHHWGMPVATVMALRRRPPVPFDHAARRHFVARTGLADVVLTEPEHYSVLLRHVEDYQRLLAARGQPRALAGAARQWRQTIYGPTVARLQASRARVRLPDRTLADLYVRLCEHKWLASERLGQDIGLDAALQDFERWSA
ncbi:MAG: hypothetical protein NVSMB65_21900 [Chloroflexota bacterium]